MENNMKRGTLYAVGVGPGEAGHLTLLAAETLRACPVIAAPRTGGGHMLALEIAQKAVPLADKTVLPLDFAMKRGEAERESAYAAAQQALCAVLDAGQDIALVNLGDVSIYASGQYLLERIRQKGYAAVMVPGVPSFCAAAARLGISLTDMQSPVHLVPGEADLAQALDWPGTKILMKTGRSLPGVLQLLAQRQLLEKSALVCDCGLADERVWPNLANQRPARGETGYFALVIVKE